MLSRGFLARGGQKILTSTHDLGNDYVREGKGQKYREVPLNKDIRKAVQEYLEVRPNSRILGKHCL
jgi:site-specific recombinase XerC